MNTPGSPDANPPRKRQFGRTRWPAIAPALSAVSASSKMLARAVPLTGCLDRDAGKTRREIVIAIAMLGCIVGNANAQSAMGAIPSTPFDSRPYVSFWGSYDVSDHLRNTGHGYGGGLAVGKPFNSGIEVEILGSFLHFGSKSATPGTGGLLGTLGLGGNPGTPAGSAQNIAVAGVGANLYFVGDDATSLHGFYAHGDMTYGKAAAFDLGAGYSIPLASIGPLSDLSLRLEALYHKQGHYDEPVFNVGLRIPIGKRPEAPLQPPPPPPPPAPEVEVAPVPVTPPPCQAIADGHGVTLDGCKRGDVIVLRGVNFDYDKATLTVNAKALLDQVAHALGKRPDIMAEIDGHTDGIGSVPYNQRLSERRAQSVKTYLVSHGIAAHRLTTRGFGKSRPIADNATPEGRELNRRVELKVIDSNGEKVIVRPPMGAMQGGGVTPALLGAPAAAAAPASAGVAISGYAFVPTELTISKGGTVTWTNNDNPAHTVSFSDGDSGAIRHGATYSRTFDKPGTYEYHCSIHPGMSGKIVVQ